MKIELLNKLLERVYYFYPIGIPSVKSIYGGDQKIKGIVEKKINQILTKEETVWSSFVQKLEETYSQRVFDMGYHQFPSYIATIELDKSENELFQFTQKLVLNISLLCSHYTIYFEDRFVFHYSKTGTLSSNLTTFFTGKSKEVGTEKADVDSIKKTVELFFPDHSFVDHKTLFDYKLSSGLPYSFSHEDYLDFKSYPLYSFLFDSHLLLDNLAILE
jgi:hypothetical protein